MHSTRFTLTSVAVLLCALLVGAEQAPPPATQPGADGCGDPQGRGNAGRKRRGARGPAKSCSRGPTPARCGAARLVSHVLAVIERSATNRGHDTHIRTDQHHPKSPLKTNGEPASGGPNPSNVDAIFMGHRDAARRCAESRTAGFVRTKAWIRRRTCRSHGVRTGLSSRAPRRPLRWHPINGPGVVITEDAVFPRRGISPAFNFTDEFTRP